MAVPIKNGKGNDGYHFVMGCLSFNTSRQGIWDPQGRRNHDKKNEYITALEEYARKQEKIRNSVGNSGDQWTGPNM